MTKPPSPVQAAAPELPLPPSAQAVPAAAVPQERAPESVLSALARAVTGRPAQPVANTAEPLPRKGRGPKTPSRPAKAAGAIPLDKPARSSPAVPTGATLPGLGETGTNLLGPVARLRAATTRDEIVTVLLDYASQLAALVGLFVVQKGQLTCLDGRGPDHVVVAMKWFTIPVGDPSPFRDVLESRAPYIGSLEDTAESRAFRNALGGTSGNLLLLPLVVGNHAVGVLYADELRADLAKLSVELETLSKEAGGAFARIILSQKKP